MNEQVVEYLQQEYEDILSAYWHKVLNIRELKETNLNNHPLRLQSIRDRESELSRIVSRRQAYELLYEDYINVPLWFVDICKKHKIV